MIEGFKIPQVTFRIREGDTSDNEIACAIGGKWTNKSTDDFFKNKRVILFSLPGDRKSTRLNSSHSQQSRMPSSA